MHISVAPVPPSVNSSDFHVFSIFAPAGRKHVKKIHLLEILVFGPKKSGEVSVRGVKFVWELLHFCQLRKGPHCTEKKVKKVKNTVNFLHLENTRFSY